MLNYKYRLIKHKNTLLITHMDIGLQSMNFDVINSCQLTKIKKLLFNQKSNWLWRP